MNDGLKRFDSWKYQGRIWFLISTIFARAGHKMKGILFGSGVSMVTEMQRIGDKRLVWIEQMGERVVQFGLCIEVRNNTYIKNS